MADAIKIGERIKIKRKALDLTLEDVAKKVDVAKSTIQRYENGTIARIKLPILEAISKALNCSPAVEPFVI